MRTALRYLCFAILVGYFGISLFGAFVEHGWSVVLAAAVMALAIAGALVL